VVVLAERCGSRHVRPLLEEVVHVVVLVSRRVQTVEALGAARHSPDEVVVGMESALEEDMVVPGCNRCIRSRPAAGEDEEEEEEELPIVLEEVVGRRVVDRPRMT
jgi:hypothetical protein